MRPRLTLAIKFFAHIMLVALLGLGLLSWLSYHEAEKIFREHASQLLASRMEAYQREIAQAVEMLRYDLTMLAANEIVKGFVRARSDPYGYDELTNKSEDQFHKEMENLFVVLAQQKPAYYQIRYLDARTGDEVVRVERAGARIVVVPQEALQNKAHRYYVRIPLEMHARGIWLSEIDLNREHRTVEFPLRPTLRATLLLDYEGEVRGLLVINVDVRRFLGFAKLQEAEEMTFVADEKGFYIFHPTQPDRVFGFEFGWDYRIDRDFPVKDLYNGSVTTKTWFDETTNTVYEARRIELAPERFLVVVKAYPNTVFEEKSHDYIRHIAFYTLAVALLIALMASLLARHVARPIRQITEIAQRIARTQGREQVNLDFRTGDEIELLARALNEMLEALLASRREIERFAEKLEEEVARKTAELQKLNEELEEKVRQGIAELRKRDQMLMHQAKLADMGEMLGAIAHQWRQPLNALALNIQVLEDLAQSGELTPERVEEIVEKAMKAVHFMSQTIDHFRNFYRMEERPSRFDVKETVLDTVELHRAQLEARGIEVVLHLSEAWVTSFRNDLMQVLLILISNARDAILRRRQREPNLKGVIQVEVRPAGSEVHIIVRDNGGGIPEDILPRIFEPYFTTKEEGQGTGLGLYMAKRLVEEKMKGQISVRNVGDGAEFTITLPVDEAGGGA